MKHAWQNVQRLEMDGLLGMYNWENLIPKGGYHLLCLGTYLWPSNGFLEGCLG